MAVIRPHNHEFKLMGFSQQGARFSGAVRAWAAAELEPGIAAWEAARHCPVKSVLQSLARHVPAARDLTVGDPAGRAEAALAIEDALAPAVAMDIAGAVSLQLNVVAPVLATYASSALRNDYLARVLGGELLVSWAMPDDGAERLLPQAVFDEGRLIVTGRVSQAMNAVGADLHAQVVRIVRAGAGETLGLVLIPSDAPGIEVRPRELLGYRCAPLADIHYQRVSVPADRLVGTAGTGGALAAQQRRAFVALSAVRLAATAAHMLGRTKAWCKERKTFGTPLIANQSVQFRLADLSANAALTLRLARAAVEAQADGGGAALAEKAKYAANQLATEVAEFATHLHGSHGYIEGTDLARFYRDTAVAVKHAGANDALLRQVFEAAPAQPRSTPAELAEFSRDVGQFVRDDVLPHIEAWERERRYPIRDLIANMGQRNIFARCYLKDGDPPQRYQFNRVLHETLAYLPGGILGSCVNNHLDAGLSLIANHAKSELAAQWRDDCIRGTRTVTLASTEQQTGSDIGEIATTAVEEGDDWVVTGGKWFISNAAIADGFCVLARTGPGTGVFDYTLFLVPSASPGVSVQALDTIGLRAGTIGSVRFEGVRIDKQHLIGVKGMGVPLTLKQFEKERLSLAMRLRSNSLFHLDLLKSHLREDRLRAGARGEQGRLEARVAEHDCELEKVRVFIDHVIAMRFRGDQVAVPVAALKLQATRAAKAVAGTLQQYFGDEGLGEHSVPARFLRDVKASSMSGGSDEMMLTVLGKL